MRKGKRENSRCCGPFSQYNTEKCKTLVTFVADKYPDNEAVQRLVKGYNPQKIMETLPTSQYTAYSENKGEKLAFCLNKQKGGDKE